MATTRIYPNIGQNARPLFNNLRNFQLPNVRRPIQPIQYGGIKQPIMQSGVNLRPRLGQNMGYLTSLLRRLNPALRNPNFIYRYPL